MHDAFFQVHASGRAAIVFLRLLGKIVHVHLSRLMVCNGCGHGSQVTDLKHSKQTLQPNAFKPQAAVVLP